MLNKPQIGCPYETDQYDEKNNYLYQITDIASRLSQISELHSKSMIYSAMDKMTELEEYIKSLKSKQDGDKLLDLYYKHPRIVRLNTEISRANKMMDLMDSSDDWKMLKDDGQWTTEYKREENTVFHSFRVNGIANTNMINILAMFYEMDLIKNWMPLSKQSYQIKQFSLYSKCGYVRIGAFWPIKDRELVVFGFGIDDLKRNNRFGFCFDTNMEPYRANLDKFGIKLPEIKKGAIRITINIGGFLMEKIKNDPNRIKLSAVFNIDPKVLIPPSVLNAVIGKFAGVFLSSIVKAANKINDDPEYIERMEQNKEFYNAMKEKM